MQRALSGKPALDDERGVRAKEIIAEQNALIAKMTLQCNVAGAKVLVDDNTVGTTPMTAGIVVARGEHVVTAQADGYLPAYRSVDVPPGGMMMVDMNLEKATKLPAAVKIKSAVPGAAVFMDGIKIAHTPIANERTFAIAAEEPHTIEVRRAGYTAKRETITLGSGESAELVLDPAEDRTAIIASGSKLRIAFALDGVTVYVNGIKRTFAEDGGDLPVAPGPHHIVAEREGYESITREIEVSPGEALAVVIDLPPTEATRAELIGDAETMRAWGWISTVGGAALVGSAIGVLVWNTKRDAVLKEERSRFDNSEPPYDDQACQDQIENQESTNNEVGCLAAFVRLGDRENRVTGFYVGSAIALAIGGGALVTGVTLLATGDSPDLFRVDIGDDLGAVTFTPYGNADHTGWNVGLRGSF
jgi:hypothetical protein